MTSTPARRIDHAATAAVAAVVVTAHLALSASVPGPSLLWDGTAYLSLARWLAGETTPYLGHLGHYGVGYPLALVPVVWATSSLEGLFDGVRVVNAVAVASTVPALVQIGTRLGGLGRSAALAVAALAAVLPAVTVQSGFEWAESLFVAAVVWSAAAALAWAEQPSTARAVVLALASSLCYLVHPRGLAVAVATFVILAIGRQRIVGIAVLVAALAGGWLLNQRAVDALWNPAVQGQWTSLRNAVTTPSTWGGGALRALGQLWYAQVATVGIAALGAWALVRLVRDRERRASAVAAWWIILALVATFAVSVAKLATATRPDQLVYGRYLDVWSVVLVVLGAGVLAAPHRWRLLRPLVAVGALTGGLTAAVAIGHPSDALSGVSMPLNVIGALVFDLADDARIDVVQATLLALLCGAIVAVVLTALDQRPALIGAALVLATIGASATVAERHVRPFAIDANSSFVLGRVLDLVDEDAPVAYDMAVFDARGTNRYSLANRDRRFTFYDSRRGETPAHDLVISGKDTTDPPAAGAHAVFPEPRREQVLWVLPGPLHDRLAARGFLIGIAGATPPSGFENGDVELVGVRDGRLVVHVAKGAGGAPWVAPGTLPSAGGEVHVEVTIAGRTMRSGLPRTLVPGDEERVVVRGDLPRAGTHAVRVRLVSEGVRDLPEFVGSLRVP